MATRSTISVVREDGSVSQVYCHWDGYLEHNGVILQKHYKDFESVKELIDNGDLSSLGTRVNPRSIHTFDSPEESVCVFYHRDRNEDGTEARHFVDMNDFYKNFQNEEYNYLFRDGTWYVRSDGQFSVFTQLDEAFEIVAAEEAV